jgi:hypothetical protein
VIDRIAAAADDSFAAILARNRLGIAMAAMIIMIATTISNSIKEKPLVVGVFILCSDLICLCNSWGI